ncbi:altered inheritance of mitochondria protein 21 [Biscogniauxia marginata]|nr:altered inheritance of mitochondria protein 21 [Biscogniauxia marginata]
MSTATMQSTPAIPPRPSRGQENNGTLPPVPPRPSRKFNRSISPNPDRFAPSPLNEHPFVPKSPRHSQSHLAVGESIQRSTSVDMPGVGEEGQEYAAAIEELGTSPDESRSQSGFPEQTRTVGENLKLYAPKPTMPAQSAKQRVAAVTRTDSERAASFGIGRPSSEDQLHSGSRSLKKKASTTSQLSHHSESHAEDELGIPEIGQRVPMLLNAGDVQAPSPAPPRAPSVEGRHHTRKTSSRNGFGDLPPGSYGLHGHGVASTAKLEKAYYEKHPDLVHKETHNHLHNRVKDYALSSEDLNKIVRDTASRGAGFGTSSGYAGTPSEQVGYQAADEYTSRMSSPQPPSTVPKDEGHTSPLKSGSTEPDNTLGGSAAAGQDDGVIHVDEPGRKGYVKFGDEESAEGQGAHGSKFHPVLASDEVAKDASPYGLEPAVAPPPERHGSAYEMEEPKSRPTSRPASIYSPPPPEVRSAPLEDVEEYEPLFPEDEKSSKEQAIQAKKLEERRQRFPSRDIWEDAPNSVHTTAEVSTPEPTQAQSKSQAPVLDVPPRDGETPAQAFARRQEELAEKEATNPDSFLNRQQKPTWAEHQAHVAQAIPPRPNMARRFPSRDVWEDTPDSLQFTTTVSTPQSTEEAQAEEAANSPVEGPAAAHKPTIPVRPKKQGSGDDSTSKPSVPERPKPQILIRPAKPASESKEPEPGAKQKPPVPVRPMGGKIAALQAGFMSDLNNRLRLGPQAPKKEEPPAEEAHEEKPKAPLSDARKGRARGPQRRAPTKTSSQSTETSAAPPAFSNNSKPILTFSMTRTLWSIDEEGTMTVDNFGPEASSEEEPKTEKVKVEETRIDEPKVDEVQVEENYKDEEPEVGISGTEIKSHEAEPRENRDTVEETKTLATNTAGESILEETVEKKEQGDEVKAVESAKDDVVS